MPLFPGVLVKPHAFQDNFRLLSGYLGFATTGDARAWFEKPEIAPLIRTFLDSSRRTFGLTGPQRYAESCVRVDRIMKLATNSNMLARIAKIPSFSEIPLDAEVGVTCYIYTIRAIIDADPGRFPDGHTPENIHRMLYILKYSMKILAHNRLAKKPRSTEVQVPEYYKHENDTRESSATNSGGETQIQMPPSELTQMPIGPILESEDSDDEGVVDLTEKPDPVETIAKELQGTGIGPLLPSYFRILG